MTKSIKFQFFPLSFSWVALHPKPIGVIYYIGGAFFGTFPTIFYRYLLNRLFEQGYTIVAIPYRFTFRHWSVAISLAKDQFTIRKRLVDEAKYRQYEYALYEEAHPLEATTHHWLGHSLGCKYIALLELLTSLEKTSHNEKASVSKEFGSCITLKAQQNLKAVLSGVDLKRVSIINQSSLLMAPAIEGLEAAIPPLRNPKFSGIKKFLNRIGIKVEPSQQETFCLINRSRLFNLTSLISFSGDARVGKPTVNWLLNNLDQRLVEAKELRGKHLAPLGWRHGDPDIAKTVGNLLADSGRKANP
jgi:hypothetical protein